VFQDPTLMPWATTLKNVMLPLTLAGVGKARRKRAPPKCWRWSA
jgi:ABC-type taurine transport system ATPase subunit